MKNPKFLEYTYYYDLRLRRDPAQIAKTIEAQKFELQLSKYFQKHLNIGKSLRDWSIKYLRDLHDSELDEHQQLHRHFSKKRSEIENKRMHIKDLLMDGLISKDDYSQKIDELDNQLKQFGENGAFEKHGESWLKKVEHIFDMAVEFSNIMEFGDKKTKKQAVRALCSNLTWDGESLSVCNPDYVSELVYGLKNIKSQNPLFEPNISLGNIERNPHFEGIRSG